MVRPKKRKTSSTSPEPSKKAKKDVEMKKKQSLPGKSVQSAPDCILNKFPREIRDQIWDLAMDDLPITRREHMCAKEVKDPVLLQVCKAIRQEAGFIYYHRRRCDLVLTVAIERISLACAWFASRAAFMESASQFGCRLYFPHDYKVELKDTEHFVHLVYNVETALSDPIELRNYWKDAFEATHVFSIVNLLALPPVHRLVELTVEGKLAGLSEQTLRQACHSSEARAMQTHFMSAWNGETVGILRRFAIANRKMEEEQQELRKRLLG